MWSFERFCLVPGRKPSPQGTAVTAGLVKTVTKVSPVIRTWRMCCCFHVLFHSQETILNDRCELHLSINNGSTGENHDEG